MTHKEEKAADPGGNVLDRRSEYRLRVWEHLDSFEYLVRAQAEQFPQELFIEEPASPATSGFKGDAAQAGR